MHHATYEIHVRGQLPPGLLSDLDGVTSREVGGETVLLWLDIDQDSLHRQVARLRDLGVELVEMRRATISGAPGTPDSGEKP
jgi:hypothetical protein